MEHRCRHAARGRCRRQRADEQTAQRMQCVAMPPHWSGSRGVLHRQRRSRVGGDAGAQNIRVIQVGHIAMQRRSAPSAAAHRERSSKDSKTGKHALVLNATQVGVRAAGGRHVHSLRTQSDSPGESVRGDDANTTQPASTLQHSAGRLYDVVVHRRRTRVVRVARTIPKIVIPPQWWSSHPRTRHPPGGTAH